MSGDRLFALVQHVLQAPHAYPDIKLVRITPDKATPTAPIPISSTLMLSSNSFSPFSHAP